MKLEDRENVTLFSQDCPHGERKRYIEGSDFLPPEMMSLFKTKIDRGSITMSTFTYSLLAGFSLFTVSAALFLLPYMGNWPQS